MPAAAALLLVTKGAQRIDTQRALGGDDCGNGRSDDKDGDGATVGPRIEVAESVKSASQELGQCGGSGYSDQ